MSKVSLRYLHNARDILKKVPIESDRYKDVKPIREAFGTMYLAILEAINDVLVKKGLTRKELPKSVEEYQKALRKYLSVHDGKLMRDFDMLYDALHIAGYYRGLIYHTKAVKDYFEAARKFISKISS